MPAAFLQEKAVVLDTTPSLSHPDHLGSYDPESVRGKRSVCADPPRLESVRRVTVSGNGSACLGRHGEDPLTALDDDFGGSRCGRAYYRGQIREADSSLLSYSLQARL